MQRDGAHGSAQTNSALGLAPDAEGRPLEWHLAEALHTGRPAPPAACVPSAASTWLTAASGLCRGWEGAAGLPRMRVKRTPCAWCGPGVRRGSSCLGPVAQTESSPGPADCALQGRAGRVVGAAPD